MTMENKEETTMERKIGEIFEYNGEWYQCVEEIHCTGCILYAKCHYRPSNIFGYCSSRKRSDHKSVIFKKLEKVGEPITVNGKNVQLLKTTIANCKNCAFYKDFSCDFTCDPRKCYGGEKGTYVEIKQVKENMEEKELKTKKIIDKLIDDYTARIITYDEFIKVVKSFYADGDESKPTLKEFDLEAAKSGKPVCTRDGRKARIVCFDAKGYRPIVALIEVDCEDDGTPEDVFLFTDKGYYNCEDITSDNDLMMLPEKKEGWVNVYKGGLLDTKSYPTKKEAFDKACPEGYVDTVKVCWEE